MQLTVGYLFLTGCFGLAAIDKNNNRYKMCGGLGYWPLWSKTCYISLDGS